jgi:hypothetical protein
VARLLQRDLVPWKEGTFGNVLPSWSLPSLTTQLFAESSIHNPVMTKCIENYVHGNGAPLHLTVAEVRQMWVVADFFGGSGFAKLKAARDDLVKEATQRHEQQKIDPESAQAAFVHPIATTGMTRRIDGDTGSALTHALGTATMTITGELSYAEAHGCTFTGTFTLNDNWDFDVLGFKSHRGLKNELETIAGRFALHGHPFLVSTDPVAVEKNQRDDDNIVKE